MKRFIRTTIGVMCAGVFVLLVVPAVSTADISTAAEQCYATEETADPTLLDSYDESEAAALATCSTEKAQQDLTNPAKQCAAERAADPEAFLAKYGTNVSKANAYGRCVSQNAHTEV